MGEARATAFHHRAQMGRQRGSPTDVDHVPTAQVRRRQRSGRGGGCRGRPFGLHQPAALFAQRGQGVVQQFLQHPDLAVAIVQHGLQPDPPAAFARQFPLAARAGLGVFGPAVAQHRSGELAALFPYLALQRLDPPVAFGQQALAAQPLFLQPVGELVPLRLQAGDPSQRPAMRTAGEMGQHMELAIDTVGQGLAQLRVGQHRPQGAGHLVLWQRVLPRLPQLGLVGDRRQLPDVARIAPLQQFVHIARGTPVPAGRAHQGRVVFEVARRCGHLHPGLAQDALQVVQGQAGADQRAMHPVFDLPQPAAARAGLVRCGSGSAFPAHAQALSASAGQPAIRRQPAIARR